ncbi:hypothetical protein OPV22_030857 [Ensete ventricosum]|uniref:Uncharacterized protein n=1 Tax=Ensete ventricosum TaxID=4639 RepID=A0AAV8NYW5_ENSVE|nr:hypothetical protein OPV22_030857 [Ensete ventricosum]RWW75329.1 hypothetical protein BHE74_00016659 [Ensete ventricosum]
MITHRGRRREGESYRSPPRALTLVGRRRRPAPTTSSSLIPSAVKPGESSRGAGNVRRFPVGPRARRTMAPEIVVSPSSRAHSLPTRRFRA